MKRSAVLVLAGVAIVLLGIGRAAGQGGQEPPAKADPKSDPQAAWSEAVEGLQCRLQADKTDWKAAEVPTFQLHVRDQGKRDLEIHMAQAACKLEFDGAWFDWVGPVSILSGPWPGGRQYDDFVVRVSLETPWTSGNRPIDLKPGKHKVRVAYVTLDHKDPVRVVSNAVEIQIEPPSKKESAAPKVKLWAGLAVTSPVVGAEDAADGRFFMISFALVNDGDKNFAPTAEVNDSKLFINGKELKEWPFVIHNGPREAPGSELKPGESLRFGKSIGTYLTQPGIYKIKWKAAAFESDEVVVRVLPK